MSKGLWFTCTRYGNRPNYCREYPWRDAQVLFTECQFVNGGSLIPLEEVMQTKSVQQIQDHCKSCGHCCFAWSRSSDGLTPVARCSSLAIQEMTDAPSQIQVMMLRIQTTIDF